MNFGMEGPQIEGWWYNPTTGDKFNAVDTYFEDNNLLIKTADGRMLNYNQVQNYVQIKDPNTIPDTKTNSKVTNTESIPAEILAEIDDEDENLLIPEDNIYGKPTKQIQTQKLGSIYEENKSSFKPAIQDFDIIERALIKKSTPRIEANVSWDDFPRREIEMLIEVMNISVNDIIQYYINNISTEIIENMVAAGIKNYIESSFCADHNEPTIKELKHKSDEIVEKSPKQKKKTSKLQK